jgi:A/G-specific adenine glycosylase
VVAQYPQKKAKTKQIPMTLHALFYTQKQQVLLQQRQAKGIWAELWFLPLFESAKALTEVIGNKPDDYFEIAHILSHRILTIKVSVVTTLNTSQNGRWVNVDKIKSIAHPSALMKIVMQNSLKEKIFNM